MGKKGGKRINRTMSNIQGNRIMRQGAGRDIVMGDLIRTYSYFDMNMLEAKNSSDYINQRLNLPLVQSLALCGCPLNDKFIEDYNFHITMSLLKLGIFADIKCLNPLSTYKPSIFNYIRTEIVSCFNNFFPDLHKDATILYIKTLAILFEYERELVESKFATVSEDSSWFCSIYDYCIYIIIFQQIK